MKRAVLCVPNPHDYLDQLDDYSIMVINPDSTQARKQYLLDHSDWSIKITVDGIQHRQGKDYADERLFWYTSGTVGDSKFYSFSQSKLDMLTKSIIDDLGITANDRYMGVMGLWHGHGQSLYWATRRAKCETKFVPIKQVRQMEDFQPTFVTAIPEVLNLIGELPLNALRFIRSGSAPLTTELHQRLKQKFKVPVVEYFGMTEAMSHVLTNPLQGRQKPGTVGIPTRGVQAKIDHGHLWIQSTLAHTQEWFDTGDLATQDEDGYYKILGRSVDQINIKGYKINPVSVEQQVKKLLPEITDIVIFGNESFHCVYVGPVDSKQVTKVLQSIHTACFPNMIQQVEVIPDSGTGKKSRTWLCKYFDCK